MTDLAKTARALIDECAPGLADDVKSAVAQKVAQALEHLVATAPRPLELPLSTDGLPVELGKCLQSVVANMRLAQLTARKACLEHASATLMLAVGAALRVVSEARTPAAAQRH